MWTPVIKKFHTSGLKYCDRTHRIKLWRNRFPRIVMQISKVRRWRKEFLNKRKSLWEKSTISCIVWKFHRKYFFHSLYFFFIHHLSWHILTYDNVNKCSILPLQVVPLSDSENKSIYILFSFLTFLSRTKTLKIKQFLQITATKCSCYYRQRKHIKWKLKQYNHMHLSFIFLMKRFYS